MAGGGEREEGLLLVLDLCGWDVSVRALACSRCRGLASRESSATVYNMTFQDG